MNEQTQVSEDLRYVRGVVEPSGRLHLPRAVVLVWAAIVLIGFPLPDFVDQDAILRYWLVVGPVGFLVCALLSARHMRSSGVADTLLARRQFAHWSVLFLATALAFLMPQTGMVEWPVLAPLLLLLVALVYLMAGVHLDRVFAVPGVAFALGYCLLIYGVAFAWTIVGVLASLSLVVCFEVSQRSRVRPLA